MATHNPISGKWTELGDGSRLRRHLLTILRGSLPGGHQECPRQSRGVYQTVLSTSLLGAKVSVNRNELPCPTVESTHMVPPWASQSTSRCGGLSPSLLQRDRAVRIPLGTTILHVAALTFPHLLTNYHGCWARFKGKAR